MLKKLLSVTALLLVTSHFVNSKDDGVGANDDAEVFSEGSFLDDFLGDDRRFMIERSMIYNMHDHVQSKIDGLKKIFGRNDPGSHSKPKKPVDPEVNLNPQGIVRR